MKRLLTIIALFIIINICFAGNTLASYGDPLLPLEVEETESFTYTDYDTGVTFTVSANWKQEEFTESKDYTDIKFISTKEAGNVMVYGSTDLWSELSDSEKDDLKRSDMNNFFISKFDIAEICDTTVDKISTVTYNGVVYYKGESALSLDAFDYTATMTSLACVKNGWLYYFRFYGESTDNLFFDFEETVRSVQYPSELKETIYGSIDDSTIEIIICIVLIIVCVVFVMLVLIYKYNNKRVLYSDCTTEQTFDNAVICRNCGQSVPSDSAFCYMCGVKITYGDES